MKEVKVICPNCGLEMIFENWFVWIVATPFHMFGKRRVTCTECGKKSYMKRVK